MIYRTGDTRIPNPLLIDLPPPSDYASDQSPFGSKQNLQESSVGEATPPVVKKMTMMKRNPNRDNDVKKESSKKEKQTAEEKEKAYAEARARIFGAEAEAATSTAAVSTVVPATTHLKKSTSEGKLEKAQRPLHLQSPRGRTPPTLLQLTAPRRRFSLQQLRNLLGWKGMAALLQAVNQQISQELQQYHLHHQTVRMTVERGRRKQ
jgi:hypothetical protein